MDDNEDGGDKEEEEEEEKERTRQWDRTEVAFVCLYYNFSKLSFQPFCLFALRF